MRCPRCAAEVPLAESCAGSGEALPAPVCPSCGAVRPPDARFCPECGARLAGRGGAQGTRPPAEAERRQLTVLLADLVGSTALAARLDPEEMRDVLQAFRAVCSEAVDRYDGFVAQFLGDGVLAYFGWPLAHEEDAERAVRAGLELTAATARLSPPGVGAALAARVGIATGLVVVGDRVGSEEARERAVIGETPNLAARLQALGGPGEVIIADGTRRLLGDVAELEDLGTPRLKGFAEPVRAWKVRGLRALEGRFEAREAGAALTPLVGREEELALLLRRWELAREGEGQAVLLSGEPGIGKSRLVRALRERLPDDPHTMLRCQCSPYHVNTSLYPVIEQLSRAARLEREDTAEARLAKLEALLAQAEPGARSAAPLLAPLLSIPILPERAPSPELTPQRLKELRLRVLVDQLAGLARTAPVMVVLEDAHWADPTTLELFALAVDRIRELRVLIVVTFRPELVPPWAVRAHVTSLTLSRLGRRDTGAMVAHIAGGRTLSPPVLAQIAARADGVPLYIEELTKAVLEAGVLHEAGQGCEPAASLPPAAIPSTLHDSLMARLDRLGPVKEVAQIAACIGREFRHELLAAVAPPGIKLAHALDRLRAAELVFRRGAPPDAAYAFKHALVRDAAHQSLLRSRRQQIHARIAHVLEERFPEAAATQPEALAHHCSEAGLVERAIEYRHKAAQVAMRRSAMSEAVAQVREGLALLPALAAGPARTRKEVDLQVDLGHALTTLKGLAAPDTGAAYARARALCRELGGGDPEPVALHGVWRFLHNRAELVAAQEVAEELLRWGKVRGDVAVEVLGHRSAAATRFFRGELSTALGHYERVLALSAPARHDAADNPLDPRLVTISHMSWELLLQGYPDQACARRREALAAAETWAWPYMQAVVMHHQNVLDQLRGDRRGVERRTAATMALTAAHGFTHWHATATILHGWAIAARGDLEAGLGEMRRGLVAKEATGARLKLPYYLGLMAGLLGRAGCGGEALPLVEDALGRAEATGERWCEAELHRLKGEVLLAADPAGAEACFRRAVEVARGQGARWWELRAATSLAALWADQGRRRRAHELLAPIHGWFGEGGDTPALQEARELLEVLPGPPAAAWARAPQAAGW